EGADADRRADDRLDDVHQEMRVADSAAEQPVDEGARRQGPDRPDDKAHEAEPDADLVRSPAEGAVEIRRQPGADAVDDRPKDREAQEVAHQQTTPPPQEVAEGLGAIVDHRDSEGRAAPRLATEERRQSQEEARRAKGYKD